MENQSSLKKRIQGLNEDYSRIQINSDLKEKIISDEINVLYGKIWTLQSESFSNKSESIEKKNEIVLNIGNDALKKLSGNVVDLSFYRYFEGTFAKVSKLDIQRNNKKIIFNENIEDAVKVTKSNVASLLEGIVNNAELFEGFVNNSESYCAELSKRSENANEEVQNLLRTISPNIKGLYQDTLTQSNESLKSFIPLIKEAKYKLGDEVKKIDENLPFMISEFCELPISGFSKKGGLYFKENKDSTSFIIDNSKNLISKGLLKKIEKVDSRNYPKLIYLKLNNEIKNDFSDLVNILDRKRNRKFNPSKSINDFINDYAKISVSLFGAGAVAGGLGKIVYEWVDSWITRIPVESLTGPLYLASITGGILTSLYLSGKGIGGIKNKIKDIQKTKSVNNQLVNIINSSQYVFTPNSREIVRSLASDYK